MAARRILQLGDPVLREISAPVADWRAAAETLRDLDDTLAEFRSTHGFGRGISAIQIGVPLRIIFLRVEETVYELVNPAHTWQSEETFELWDDCFSFPELMVRPRRHRAVRLRHQDGAGEWREFTAEGSLSELIQHEMDHLDGILAVDRAESPRDFATRAEYLRQRVSGG